MGYKQDVFDIELFIELDVDECLFGVFGLLQSSDGAQGKGTNPATAPSLDCFKRTYKPELPMLKLSFLEEWDLLLEYFEWTCNYTINNPIENGKEMEKKDKKTGSDLDYDEIDKDFITPSNVVQ